MSSEQVTPTWENYIEVPKTQAKEALETLEAAMPTGLPPAVRDLILTRAGQVTEPEGIRISDRRESAFGPVLFAGGEKGHARYSYSVEQKISMLENWSEVPFKQLRLFPFATNTGHGVFCVDFREEPLSIVFVDMDYDLEEVGSITPVAQSIDELWSRLC